MPAVKTFQYTYDTNKGTHKGFFNIYQAKNGSIQLCMGHINVPLTKEQVDKLPINPYALNDFDQEKYNEYYTEFNYGAIVH